MALVQKPNHNELYQVEYNRPNENAYFKRIKYGKTNEKANEKVNEKTNEKTNEPYKEDKTIRVVMMASMFYLFISSMKKETLCGMKQ